MKYFVKLFVVTSFLLLYTHSYAQAKVAYLDMTYILNKSKIYKIHIYGKDVAETFEGIKKNKKGRILRKISDIYDLIIKI